MPKSTTPHLTPLTLLETSASYSMNTSPFLTRSHLSPNLAITIFGSFAVSVYTTILKQIPLLPLPLFTASLTTATLFIVIKHLPKCQITRLQQIQNSLARAVVKGPKSSHITPTLRSLQWLKITERIEYKLLSLTYKVLTLTQPSYLHNLITCSSVTSQHSLFIFGHTRSSIYIIFSTNNRSFLPVCFPSSLESTPGSVNHALVSPILTHPVL